MTNDKSRAKAGGRTEGEASVQSSEPGSSPAQGSGKPGFNVVPIVAVFVAALMAGCSGDGILDSEEGRLTKRGIRGPVNLVIRLEPETVGVEISFTRSVSGRPVDYAWSTTTDSGFESLTQLYWSRIRATFTPE